MDFTEARIEPRDMNKIWVGTSGWSYPYWKGNFYPAGFPQKEQFNYYLRFFRTVEINNSFYKLPSAETFSTWAAAVPDGFLYAVKASRYITHMKKLKDPVQSLEKFMHAVNFLEDRLGPILFQLPPFWKLNLDRLREFLEVLPKGYRYAFEFRNESWYDERVYELLAAHNIAFCIYELEYHQSPVPLTADFVYVRLHGPEGKYAGSYSDEALQEWCKQAKEWQSQGKDVYIYFDNDQNGYAGFNARALKEMVERNEP